jgi:N-acetylglucosamine-6-sulfatase
VVSQVVQNVDLYPTFVQLAGQTPAPQVEGHSLVPLLHPSDAAAPWRTVALVEHQGGNTDPADPDFEGGGSNPTTYDAIRISTKELAGFDGPVEGVYVEYKDRQNETEFYDISKDPFEQHNIAAELTAAQRSELHGIVAKMEACHSASACWEAALPS